jgi:hypothetical protein
LEDQVPFDPELHNEIANDTCVENFSVAILKTLATPTPKCRPHVDPRPPVPVCIQDEICLKNRLWRRWQIIRDPVPTAEINRLQMPVTRRLEWMNDQ